MAGSRYALPPSPSPASPELADFYSDINLRFNNLCWSSRGGGTVLFSQCSFSDIFLSVLTQLLASDAFFLEKGIR